MRSMGTMGVKGAGVLRGRGGHRGIAGVAIPLLSMLNIAACTSAQRILVADDLVAELRNAGVPIETQEPAPIPSGSQFRFDEGVRVKGQGLFVDILRIEDRRVFDIAKSAGRLLVVAEAVAGQPIPDNPSVYARHPFVVIIRQQPEGLALEHTLAKILPPEPE